MSRGPRYAQLLFNRDVTFGEVVSNIYLSGSDLLTTAQEDRLLGLGWMPPRTRCSSLCERSHTNFHRTWPQGVPDERIVRDLMVAVAFVVVRGEGEPLKLVASASPPVSGTAVQPLMQDDRECP